MGKDSLDFSFSGVKTAVLYYVRDACRGRRVRPPLVYDICRAFQDAVLDVVVEKTILACAKMKVPKVVVGGGVSANAVLREKLTRACGERGMRVFFPGRAYCTDNGAMVGLLGERLYRQGIVSDFSMTADPNLAA